MFIIFVLKFILFVWTFLFIIDFIAFFIALVSILFYTESYFLRYTGIVYLTLPTLIKWINKNNALDKYTEIYYRFLLHIIGFNVEDSEPCLSEFLHDKNAENIVTEKTCFKSLTNPSCIDLFLTNFRMLVQ